MLRTANLAFTDKIDFYILEFCETGSEAKVTFLNLPPTPKEFRNQKLRFYIAAGLVKVGSAVSEILRATKKIIITIKVEEHSVERM